MSNSITDLASGRKMTLSEFIRLNRTSSPQPTSTTTTTTATLPPLPKAADAPASPLSWSVFDAAADQWVPRGDTAAALRDGSSQSAEADLPTAPLDELSLVTWNVDGFGYEHAARMSGILSAVREAGPDPPSADEAGPDVLFLQEVSRTALKTLLQDPWVRGAYYVSGADWAQATVTDHPFHNITLLARRRRLAPGAVWYVRYPSLFGRYAMCCDVGVGPGETVRLANVHLDSLQNRPSRRPRQLAAVANILRAAAGAAAGGGEGGGSRARGLVAGDFNPVLPDEDEGLVAANGLVDCWTHLRPAEADGGFTWGVDGMARYPPARLDRVAVLGLTPKTIDVLHPGTVPFVTTKWHEDEEDEDEEEETQISWSDHSGVRATFGLD